MTEDSGSLAENEPAEERDRAFAVELQILRQAALVVLDNLDPPDDEGTDALQFQLEAAIRCWLLGGPRVALPLLDVLAHRYPERPDAEYFAGCILAGENDPAALSHLEKAIQLDPWRYRRYAGEARRLIARLHGPEEARHYWDATRRRYGPSIVAARMKRCNG